MLVVQIKRDVLEKSQKGGRLVPVKRTVTRGGKAFQMTFWVDPEEKKTEGTPQGSLFDMEEVGAKHVASRPVKNGDKITLEGKDLTVKLRDGFVYLEDENGTVEWGTQAGKELPTAAQIAASVQDGRNKNIFENSDEPAASTGGDGKSAGDPRNRIKGPEILKDAYSALNEVRNFHYHGELFETTYDLASAIEKRAIDTTSALYEVREAFSMMKNHKLQGGKYPDTYAVANAIDEAFHAKGTRGSRDEHALNGGHEPLWRANGVSLEVKKPGCDKWEFMVNTDDPEKTKALVAKMEAFSDKKPLKKSIGLFIRNLKLGR